MEIQYKRIQIIQPIQQMQKTRESIRTEIKIVKESKFVNGRGPAITKIHRSFLKTLKLTRQKNHLRYTMKIWT